MLLHFDEKKIVLFIEIQCGLHYIQAGLFFLSILTFNAKNEIFCRALFWSALETWSSELRSSNPVV